MNSVRKLLVSVLAVSVVVSCGGSDESADAPDVNASSDDVATEVDDFNNEPVEEDAGGGDVESVADDSRTDEAPDGYLDEIGLDGSDPDSIFARYRFWSSGVRFRETLPGAKNDVVDNPLENNTGVLAEQSVGAGTGGKVFLRGVVSTDYDSAWLRNGTDELVRARFDSTELETILIEDLVPAGQLRAIGGDADALYLVVNSDTGTKANFIIELDPATGVERNRIDLSTVSTVLGSLDVNDTHIAVSRARGEVVVVDRATFAEAYTLQLTEGENDLSPLLTTDEIYVISPGRGDVVDLLSRFSLSDGSLLEADRALPYAGVNRAFGDIVVHWNSDLTEMPVYGLSPDGEQLVDALPDDLEKIYDVHIGDQFIVVGGSGAVDPDTNDRIGIFFVERATNTVVWTMAEYLGAPGMDIVAPPA